MDHIDVEWFTVWNRDLASKSKKDFTSTGRAVTSDLASSSLDTIGNTANPDEDDDEESGILYKYAANQDEAGESLSRRIGLAQGLIDFASSFRAAKQAECDDNAVRVVNSARQRMIFLRPEPSESYWIVCALPTSHAGVVHSRESSAASTVTPSAASKSPTGLQGNALNSEAYVGLVKDAYSEFALLHGDFSYIYEARGMNALQDALKTFFDSWCRRPVNISGLGILRSSAMNSLPINDALLPFSPTNLLILSIEGILHLPDSPLVPHKTSLAIARYLEPRLNRTRDDGDPDGHVAKSKKHLSSFGVPHGATSTWKRTLSLGGLGGYIGLPGANVMSKPKMSDADAKIMGNEGFHNAGAEKSWINPMNLFGGSPKPKAAATTAEVDTNVLVSSAASITSAPLAPEATKLLDSPADSDAGVEGADQDDTVVESRKDHSDMRRSASLGVSEALQAAIDAELHAPRDEGQFSPSRAAAPQPGPDTFEVKPVFIQEIKKWKSIHVIEVDDFILAYIGEPPNVHSAKRIASACKKVLSGLPPTTSLQYYQSNSKSAVDYVNIDNTALSASASLEAHQASASSAIADLARFTTSHLSELFVRTSLSTWLVARPARANDSSDQLSDITVLPKSVGKEGSLVDADAEIQRGG